MKPTWKRVPSKIQQVPNLLIVKQRSVWKPTITDPSLWSVSWYFSWQTDAVGSLRASGWIANSAGTVTTFLWEICVFVRKVWINKVGCDLCVRVCSQIWLIRLLWEAVHTLTRGPFPRRKQFLCKKTSLQNVWIPAARSLHHILPNHQEEAFQNKRKYWIRHDSSEPISLQQTSSLITHPKSVQEHEHTEVSATQTSEASLASPAALLEHCGYWETLP